MAHVFVRILHRRPPAGAGPLECLLSAARRSLADSQAAAFFAAGADDVAVVEQGAGESFRDGFVDAVGASESGAGKITGLVLLGSGSIPLATSADLRRFIDAASTPAGPVLTNNRYSGDVVAIPAVAELTWVPDLPGDNALPRWLDEVAGRAVRDLRSVWRLQVDVDGPLDLILLQAAGRLPPGLRGADAEDSESPLLGAPMTGVPFADSPVLGRLAAVRATLANRRAEVVLSGRVSTRSLAVFERTTASRTRVLIEERGLRAGSRNAWPADDGRPLRPRPPASLLGLLLDRGGPAALGALLARLGDAALVDSRVLLAHGLGADEATWPSAEDRFASDLLLPDLVRDEWLAALTTSAVEAAIPVLLGGHSLLGPGLRLVAEPRRLTK